MRGTLSPSQIDAITHTSPWASFVKTFSIVNDLLFVPPLATYRFKYLERRAHNYLAESAAGTELNLLNDDASPATTRSNGADLSQRSNRQADAAEETGILIRLLFFPWVHRSPVDRVIGSRPFLLHAGCPIPCLHISVPRATHLMVFFHGNASDINPTYNDRMTRYAMELCVDVLEIEYPGYGLHVGEPSEASAVRTAERVMQFIFSTSVLPPSRIILAGESVGAGVAVSLLKTLCDITIPSSMPQEHKYPAALILKSAFTSMKNVMADDVSLRSRRWLRHIVNTLPERNVQVASLFRSNNEIDTSPVDMAGLAPTPQHSTILSVGQRFVMDRFENRAILRELSRAYNLFSFMPTLFVHGLEDEVVSVKHSVSLAEGLGPYSVRAYVCILPTSTHNSLSATSQIKQFFADEGVLLLDRREREGDAVLSPMNFADSANSRQQGRATRERLTSRTLRREKTTEPSPPRENPSNSDRQAASGSGGGGGGEQAASSSVRAEGANAFVSGNVTTYEEQPPPAVAAEDDTTPLRNNGRLASRRIRPTTEADGGGGEERGTSAAIGRDEAEEPALQSAPLSSLLFRLQPETLVTPKDASTQHTRHIFAVLASRAAVVALIMMYGLYNLVVATVYASLDGISSRTQGLVSAWGVGVFVSLWLVGVLTAMTARCGTASFNQHLVAKQHSWSATIGYISLRLLAYLIWLTFGIVLGPVLSFRDGALISWNSERQIDRVVRGSMIALFILQVLHIFLVLIRNK